MKLTLAEAAVGAGAVLEAPASLSNAGALEALGYSIDSRTVEPGELFFAVRGERFDGHDFVEAALKRGAVAAVVSRAKAGTLTDEVLAAPLLIAEDPLTAASATYAGTAPPTSHASHPATSSSQSTARSSRTKHCRRPFVRPRVQPNRSASLCRQISSSAPRRLTITTASASLLLSASTARPRISTTSSNLSPNLKPLRKNPKPAMSRASSRPNKIGLPISAGRSFRLPLLARGQRYG